MMVCWTVIVTCETVPESDSECGIAMGCERDMDAMFCVT